MPEHYPYLAFQPPRNVPPPVPDTSRRFFPPKGRGAKAQWDRLGPQLKRLEEALNNRTLELTASAPCVVAEDVLVFELASSYRDFFDAVRQIEGLEWLVEMEQDFDPGTEDFYFLKKDKEGKMVRDEKKALNGVLYMIATNAEALREVQSAWERKAAKKPLSGAASKLGELLNHVINVRAWGWRDRLGEAGIELWKDEIGIGNERLRFEAELWFREDAQKRQQIRFKFEQKVTAAGGQAMSSFDHDGSGYHGVLVELTADAVKQLLDDPESSAILNEESVYHFWPVGQAIAPPVEAEEFGVYQGDTGQKATGGPDIALLDGFPVANHPLLRDHLIIDDPDGWESEYPAETRKHGTGMASLIVRGDLNGNVALLSRPLYVRPIMRAEWDKHQEEWRERIPSDIRPNDLLERVVLRIKAGDGSVEPVAPEVKAINLSIADIHRVFDGNPSAWARMLDWLQWKYNVLFLVSAGNAPRLDFPMSLAGFQSLSEESKETAVMAVLQTTKRHLRLLSPAETINGLTIGSAHTDRSGEVSLPPALVIPVRHPDFPSPSSRLGPGFRKSVKPDMLMPGGRQPLRLIESSGGLYSRAYDGSKSPGIKVAAPPSEMEGSRTWHIRGTSAATALATRKCAGIFEQLRQVIGDPMPDEFVPVLAKALLVHGSCWRDAGAHLKKLLGCSDVSHSQWKSGTVSPLIGFGRADEEELQLSTDHRATVLGWGTIAAGEIHEFRLPLPNSLSGQKGRKRFTVTLAWFSPINPRHRRYRRANLCCHFPQEPDNIVAGKARRDSDHAQVGRGTVEHLIFEGSAARGYGTEWFPIEVTCEADAGELEESVRYGLAVSLECAPEISTKVFAEVRNALRVPVPVATR